MRLSIRLGLNLAVVCLLAAHSEAIALGPDAAQIDELMTRSHILMHNGHIQEAIELLQRSCNQYPNSGLLHFQLGNAFSDLKYYPQAINEYQVSLKLQPGFPASVLNTAYAYVNAGDVDSAMPWFDRYLKENPHAINKAEVQGQMLVAQSSKCSKEKRYFDAKNLLEQACQVNPTSYAVHFKLARACDELGDTRRAIHEYEEALRLKPDHTAAIFNIAGCYQTLGQTAEAIAWFQKYLAIEPNASDRSTVYNMIEKLKEKRTEQSADPRKPDYIEAVVENGKLYRWPREHLPLKVFIGPGESVPTFRDSYRGAFLESLTAWAQASLNKMTFVLVNDSKIADITCEWTGDPYEVRQTGSDVEQGVCFMQAHGESLIAKANLRILTIDRETGKPISDDDMKKTCLHELGHALGLRGHSNNNHDTMFYTVSPTVWPVLSKRDKATIQRLYETYPQSNLVDASR